MIASATFQALNNVLPKKTVVTLKTRQSESYSIQTSKNTISQLSKEVKARISSYSTKEVADSNGLILISDKKVIIHKYDLGSANIDFLDEVLIEGESFRHILTSVSVDGSIIKIQVRA